MILLRNNTAFSNVFKSVLLKKKKGAYCSSRHQRYKAIFAAISSLGDRREKVWLLLWNSLT